VLTALVNWLVGNLAAWVAWATAAAKWGIQHHL
jgi:hypothetical protein